MTPEDLVVLVVHACLEVPNEMAKMEYYFVNGDVVELHRNYLCHTKNNCHKNYFVPKDQVLFLF